MSKENILVTGANGFIGRALIKMLVEHQYNVYALDQDYSKIADISNIKEFFHQDITTSFKIENSFDHVFHLGALNVTHVGKSEYKDYERVNIEGTKNLIKAVKTQHFIFMSTVKVYQKQENVIDEMSPIGPEAAYEKSKLEAETVCQKYFDEQNLTIFRLINVVGPGQAAKAIIPVFFQKALSNEPLQIIHPSKTLLHFLYIDDLLNAFLLLLQKKSSVGIMNLCSEATITLGDFAKEVVSMCNSSSAIESVSDDDVTQIRFASSRAESVLEWKAQTSVDTILNKFYVNFSVNA